MTCMVATTMILNKALIMITDQHSKHMLLYSIQPQRHCPTPGSLVEGAALLLMQRLARSLTDWGGNQFWIVKLPVGQQHN